METNQSSPNQNLIESEVQPQQTGSNQKLFIAVVISILLTSMLTGSAVYFWQKSTSEKAINNLRQEITTLRNQVPRVDTTQTTPLPTFQPEFSVPKNQSIGNKFSYNNFSLSYPDDWTLLDMSTSETFPLKERLGSLYGSDKVIALDKNGLYLIIAVEQESEGSAGGIFIDDNDYNEFVSNKDKVIIGNSVFYLTKNHSDIPSLLESHSGPYMWGVLAEYLPNKKTGSGNVFKGYENVIKRNVYSYNFIITSNEGGATDPQLQREIIDILETIEW